MIWVDVVVYPHGPAAYLNFPYKMPSERFCLGDVTKVMELLKELEQAVQYMVTHDLKPTPDDRQEELEFG